MAKHIGAFAFVFVIIFSATGFTQDRLLDELYGRGVHNYFARDYQAAHKMLTLAIDQGSQDPRVFYYRGLTYQNLGRPEEANADFQKGAELELANVVPVSVSRALERVQGSIRLTIETHRQEARIAARTENLARDRARYEQFQDNEQEVLRNPNQTPPPASAISPEAKQESDDDPFPDAGSGLSGGPGEVAPAEPMNTASEDPFGALPAAAPAADPFGAPAAQPMDDAFGAPAAQPMDDGFGAPAAQPMDDIFGAPPAAGPAPANDLGDPFGDDNAVDMGGGAAPMAAPPAGEPPAAAPARDDSDLFGGGADDVFGGGAPAPAPAPAPAGGPPPAAAPPMAEPMDGGAPPADPFGAAAPAMEDAGGAAGGNDAGAGDPFADDPF
jgi:hypothetical protein